MTGEMVDGGVMDAIRASAQVAEPAVSELFASRNRSCELIMEKLRGYRGTSVSRLGLLLAVRPGMDEFRPKYCLLSLDGDLDWLEEQGKVQLDDCFVELRAALAD